LQFFPSETRALPHFDLTELVKFTDSPTPSGKKLLTQSEFVSPQNGFVSPQSEFVPPESEFVSPQSGFVPPQSEFVPPQNNQ
jgi:hypothetical protein